MDIKQVSAGVASGLAATALVAVLSGCAASAGASTIGTDADGAVSFNLTNYMGKGISSIACKASEADSYGDVLKQDGYLPYGKSAVIYFDGADASGAYDLDINCEDGTRYELHAVELGDVKDATLRTDGRLGYLIYTSNADGGTVDTLVDEETLAGAETPVARAKAEKQIVKKEAEKVKKAKAAKKKPAKKVSVTKAADESAKKASRSSASTAGSSSSSSSRSSSSGSSSSSKSSSGTRSSSASSSRSSSGSKSGGSSSRSKSGSGSAGAGSSKSSSSASKSSSSESSSSGSSKSSSSGSSKSGSGSSSKSTGLSSGSGSGSSSSGASEDACVDDILLK